MTKPLRLAMMSIACISSLTLEVLMLFVQSQYEGNAAFPADCALVFGAAVHVKLDNEGAIAVTEPSPALLRRIETAAVLYREKKVKKLILSGGLGEGKKEPEATVMRRVALLSGIDPEDAILEPNARSTKENLLLSRLLAKDCESVIGVSDRWHLARIEFLAESVGWNIGTYPARGRPPWYAELRSVLREALGLIYYALGAPLEELILP